MYSSRDLPWHKIHSFLLDIGNVREPKEFCVQVINEIYQLIPYDQACIYFVNDNGKVYDELLIGVDQRWSKVYHEYYSKVDNGRYGIPTSRSFLPDKLGNGYYAISRRDGGVYDWVNCERDTFFTEYIKPQGINYSAGFGLHGVDDSIKSVCSMARTSRSGYTPEEINIMCIIQSHLDNLHKNMFVFSPGTLQILNSGLTQREAEIAELLCKGLIPARISKKLCVSISTVYRHIANMHTKLNVSNRQELILKLIDLQ